MQRPSQLRRLLQYEDYDGDEGDEGDEGNEGNGGVAVGGIVAIILVLVLVLGSAATAIALWRLGYCPTIIAYMRGGDNDKGMPQGGYAYPQQPGGYVQQYQPYSGVQQPAWQVHREQVPIAPVSSMHASAAPTGSDGAASHAGWPAYHAAPSTPPSEAAYASPDAMQSVQSGASLPQVAPQLQPVAASPFLQQPHQPHQPQQPHQPLHSQPPSPFQNGQCAPQPQPQQQQPQSQPMPQPQPQPQPPQYQQFGHPHGGSHGAQPRQGPQPPHPHSAQPPQHAQQPAYSFQGQHVQQIVYASGCGHAPGAPAAPAAASEGSRPAPRSTRESTTGSASGQSKLAVASQLSPGSSLITPAASAANVDIRDSRESNASAPRGGWARTRVAPQQRAMEALQCLVTLTNAGPSVSTWSNWDRTAREATIRSTLTERSTPGDMLEGQLDWIERHRGGVLLPHVKLAADAKSKGRRVGGQGAVAFAHETNDARRELAVKFFFTPAAFTTETNIVQVEAIRSVMPPVFAIESDEKRRDTSDMPPPLNARCLPAMLIVEKGESLDEFVKRKAPDFFTALQVLVHIATKLKTLHGAGWIHRDLKPANTIWLPSQNQWALIDFGCAAREGDLASVSFSLCYAAPETVRAFTRGELGVTASAAADVFALGVMCWEMFTGEPFYGHGATFESVVDILVGKGSLATEQPLLPETRKKLGSSQFRLSLMRALSRDPQQRPSIAELLASWTSIFSATQE